MKLTNKYLEIIEHLSNSHDINSIGLLGGALGKYILLLHHNKYVNKDEGVELTIEFLKNIIENMIVENQSPTYCNGISGFGVLIEYIEQNDFIELDTQEILQELDHYLFQKMILMIEKGNYDFLHGAIGIGYYFIFRAKVVI